MNVQNPGSAENEAETQSLAGGRNNDEQGKWEELDDEIDVSLEKKMDEDLKVMIKDHTYCFGVGTGEEVIEKLARIGIMSEGEFIKEMWRINA